MNKTIIKTALEEAQKAFDTDEIPVGAVLFETNTGKIIATAHNQTEKMNDISAHAEILALREGGKILKTNHFSGYSLFTTLEPCPMCAGAILHARIPRVVCGCTDPVAGAMGSVWALHRHPVQNQHTRVEVGCLEDECREVLQEFFRARRDDR